MNRNQNYVDKKLQFRKHMARKTISVSKENHKELIKLGSYSKNMDDIIRRLIENWKKLHKQ